MVERKFQLFSESFIRFLFFLDRLPFRTGRKKVSKRYTGTLSKLRGNPRPLYKKGRVANKTSR